MLNLIQIDNMKTGPIPSNPATAHLFIVPLKSSLHPLMSQQKETPKLPTIGNQNLHSNETNSENALNNRQQKRVYLAIEYIRKHYRNKISAEHLSFEVNLSVAKLQAGMKAVTGKTVAGFIEHVRIEEGKILLSNTDHTIAHISKEVGFKTQSHFGDVFKKLTGQSPLQYRNCYGC